MLPICLGLLISQYLSYFPEVTYNRNKVFLTGSQNHRIIHAGRGTGGLWSNLLLKQGQVWDQNSFLRTLSSQVLKTCKDRDSTTSRVKLLHSSTLPMGNKFLLVSSLDHRCSTYALCLSPSHQASPWRGWLCVLITSLTVVKGFRPPHSYLVSRLNKSWSLCLSPQDKCLSPDHSEGPLLNMSMSFFSWGPETGCSNAYVVYWVLSRLGWPLVLMVLFM